MVIVKEGEDVITAASHLLLSSLEETLLRKLNELNKMMKEEDDLGRLVELSTLIARILDNLEKVRRIARMR